MKEILNMSQFPFGGTWEGHVGELASPDPLALSTSQSRDALFLPPFNTEKCSGVITAYLCNFLFSAADPTAAYPARHFYYFFFRDELPSHDCLHPALRRLSLITSRE